MLQHSSQAPKVRIPSARMSLWTEARQLKMVRRVGGYETGSTTNKSSMEENINY